MFFENSFNWKHKGWNVIMFQLTPLVFFKTRQTIQFEQYNYNLWDD